MVEVITDVNLRGFVHSSVAKSFGLSIEVIAEKCKNDGRFSSWLNSDITKIKEVLTTVEENGVSPAFFAAYEKTEGYNSQWGWLNHTVPNGNPVEDAVSVSDWIVSQSNNTTDAPAWIDFANYNDFVPSDVKTAGNEDFTNMTLGSIGKVVIAGTAAATWEVYFPNGLLATYNGVQDYGTPINHMMNYIIDWGGSVDGTTEPPEDTPDVPYDGIDLDGFGKELNELITTLLSGDVYKAGNSQFYQNESITLMKQLENTYKIKPNQNFYDAINNKLKDFNGSYVPEEPTPDPEEPTDPVPTGEKLFPVRIANGINFFKRSLHGVGTLQRNMTYGVRSTGANHFGYDIGGGGYPHNIYSVTDGEVVRANFANGIGNRVTIKNLNDNYFLEYGHLASSSVNVGDIVSAGDLIAVMGKTGGNYAVHLDLKIATAINGFYSWETTIDPEKYLGVTGDGQTTLSLP